MPTLNFKGKALVQNFHLLVPYHELKPVKSKSLTDKVSLHDNLVVHGDNLKALKALLPYYHGKVSFIYLDPPYNTGSENWKYNDNVSSPMIQEWIGKEVGRDDLTRHDKWLAVSIDQNEVFSLGVLMDEIFGEERFLACAPWLSEVSGGKQKTGLRAGHEYILIYHNGDASSVTQEEKSTGDLNLEDEYGKYRKGRELRKWGDGSLREDRKEMWFSLVAPDGTKASPVRNDGKEGRWRWGKEGKMKVVIENPKLAHWEMVTYDEGVVVDGQTERWVPFEKVRDKKRSFGWNTWLDSYGTNADATRELKEIFGEKALETAKPVALIQWLVSLHENENAVVLDPFAGSGTLGQSVLALNKEDGGKNVFQKDKWLWTSDTAATSTFGYLLPTLTAILIDPQLTTHVRFGKRTYQNAGYVSMTAVWVFLATAWLWTTTLHRGRWAGTEATGRRLCISPSDQR